ncbi:MAG: presenilin family intramembrane aspartyl protease [Patescibacteria group bacterium]
MEKKKLNLLFGQIFSFLIIQILGLLTGLRFFSLPEFRQRIVVPSFSILEFLLTFAIAVLFVILFLKIFKKRRLPFKLLFYFLIFTTGSLVFLIWLRNSFLSLIFIILAFIFLHFFPNVLCQNILLAICIIGAGLYLGVALLPFQMIVILIIIALYDLVMVFGTGTMIKMFKEMMSQRVILALTIPENPKNLTTKISQVELGKGFIFLGTGDLALPMAFAISALRISLLSSIFILVGSLLGLLVLTLYFIEERRPLPALPPIIIGGILGYLISLF